MTDSGGLPMHWTNDVQSLIEDQDQITCPMGHLKRLL